MVRLNDFRMAVGLPTDNPLDAEIGEDGPRFALCEGDAEDNVRMRRQLVEALSAETDVPKSYLDMIRARLGIATEVPDEIASKPLSERDVKEIITHADSLSGFVDVEEEMLIEKTRNIVEKDAQMLLARSLNDEMAALNEELKRLCEATNLNVDATRDKMIKAFAEAAQKQAQVAMDEAMGMLVLAQPEDAETVASTVRDVCRFITELRALACTARTDPEFSFERPKWPAPPSFDGWRQLQNARKQQEATRVKNKQNDRTERKRNAIDARQRKLESEQLMELKSILMQMLTNAGKLALARNAPKEGSPLDVSLTLYVNTMKSIAESHEDDEKREFNAKVQGFRKRLSARMGFAGDDVKVKV